MKIVLFHRRITASVNIVGGVCVVCVVLFVR